MLRIWRNVKELRSKYIHQLELKRNLFKSITFYAQATAHSHPHLLKANEVTLGLTADVFRNRRSRLMKMIYEMSPETKDCHVLMIPSNCVTYMTENIPYPFRQRTDFLYLCGYKEANSVLVINTIFEKPHKYESTLFISRPSAHSERWEGVKMDLPTVSDFLGIDRALYLDELEKYLDSFAKQNKTFTVWYDLSSYISFFEKILQDFITCYRSKLSIGSLREIMHRIRILKCEAEIELMRKSCKIAAESLREVMKISRPFMLESELHAKLDYECRIRGADYLSFPPVVAGGDRANTIHYIDNNQVIRKSDMVLIDGGCEFHGYSSDLARTWPINGKFTKPQEELYEIILSIQEELIEMCTEKPSLDHLFRIMCQKLGEELQKLKLIPNCANKASLHQFAFKFCPHHVSHYLGMDVHDTSSYGRDVKLQPGMIITVEPGIYIPLNNTEVPEMYRGLCIRIEDDILIKEKGYEVLTSACPKHIKDIEGLLS